MFDKLHKRHFEQMAARRCQADLSRGRFTPAVDVPKKARLTVDVNLATQVCSFSCDTPLPLVMMADMLCQTASGLLKQALQQEAMLVGRGNNVLSANGEAASAKPDRGAIDILSNPTFKEE